MRTTLKVMAVGAVLSFGSAARAQESDAALAEQMRLRTALKTYHRSMGITTWVSLASTVAVGTLRYANVIGFGTPLCASGGAVFGADFGCGDGLKIWHLISASFTVLSYATTRILARLMPDPFGAASQDNPASRRLWWHRALSYVHLAGMVAMPILGFLASGATDPQARAGLATAHLVTGYATLGVVTIAASLEVF